MFLRRINQRGDTIVEVMIVLAVLGMALSIAYTTANRSLSNARQAQESSEATTLLQSQVEGLRILASTDTSLLDGNTFCVNTGTIPVSKEPNITQPACRGQNTAYNLTVSIKYCKATPVGDTDCNNPELRQDGTFLLKANWDNVRGNGTDSVRFTYRYYKPWNN